jgi:hypothetical protein
MACGPEELFKGEGEERGDFRVERGNEFIWVVFVGQGA